MPRCPKCFRRIAESAECPADGARAPARVFAADFVDAAMPVVPGYTIARKLGEGGFSIVWDALRHADSGRAALKIGRSNSVYVIERFRRDAEALSRISWPYVPTLFEHGLLEDGRPFIAMQLLSGKALSAFIEQCVSPLEMSAVWPIAIALFKALEAAHSQGILHRDLKPENIFWDPINSIATLIDFGMTKNVLPDNSLEITRAGAVVGTPEYMAPEQIRGDFSGDVRSDLYSAGVILYEICTLHLPFEGEHQSVSQGHLTLRPPRPRVWTSLPEDFEELILSCLAKEPARRPESAAVVWKAIEAFSEGRSVESAAFSAPSVPAISRPAASSARPHSSRADLLSEGRRPVVLLALNTKAAVTHVSEMVVKSGGTLARQKGMLYVAVFSGADIENPVKAALAVATEAARRFSAKAVLHLSPLALRRQEGRAATFFGRALERPELWMPSGEQEAPIVLTAELARTLPWGDLVEWRSNASFYVPAEDAESGLLDEPLSAGTAQKPPHTLRSPDTGIVPSSHISRVVPISSRPRSGTDESSVRIAKLTSAEQSGGFEPLEQPAGISDSDETDEGAPRPTLLSVGHEAEGSDAAPPTYLPGEIGPARAGSPEAPTTVKAPPSAERDEPLGDRLTPEPSGKRDTETRRKIFLSTMTAPPQALRPGELNPQDVREPDIAASIALSLPQSACARLPLFGRDDVCETILESAELSFSSSRPGLFTLIGDSGLGKTRIAAEARRMIEKARPGLTYLSLSAVQPLGDSVGVSARELLSLLYGFQAGQPPQDIKAKFRRRLASQAEELWPAVAGALGIAEQAAPRRTPGANQRSLMLAIAEGFRALSREGPTVFVLDDAHWADDVVLDAIEYITLNAEACPLWIMITAHPRFENVRGGWGSRTDRHDRWVLSPLREDAAIELTAELLLPAEYPPHATLRKLAAWSGNNPACLIELVHMLKQAGFVQRRPNTGTWYVVTAELDRLPPSPAWQWLAIRQLDALPPDLAACVRLCSVFGTAFCRDEIEWVLGAMEREGLSSTHMDMGVGLKALLERKILFGGQEERYSFQSSTFQDAVYKLLDSAHREAIHRYAFLYWSLRRERARGEGVSPSEEVLLRIARHGSCCGEQGESAESYFLLGESARAHHRHVEADQHYSAVLSLLQRNEIRAKARCLAGRGKVRYRVHRVREALSDLREARRFAEQIGDDWLCADLLLEEATALDWASDFNASAACAELSRELVHKLGDKGLELRLLMAEGRTACRQERSEEAIALLTESAAKAKEQGDHETRVISLLMLSVLLVAAGKLEESCVRFDEVISLCAEKEDWLHLGIAYANRSVFWAARKRLMDKGMEDLEKAAQIARQVGNPWSERIATHNVAECLHWLGHEEEAFTLASRVRILEQRFLDKAVVEGTLLLARIQLVRGCFGDARELLAWIHEHCSLELAEPTLQALAHVIELVLTQEARGDAFRATAGEAWHQVTQKASEGMFSEGLLEVLYWRARTAVSASLWPEVEEILKEARIKLEECPFWRFRFTDLETRLLLRQSEPLLVPLSRIPNSPNSRR